MSETNNNVIELEDVAFSWPGQRTNVIEISVLHLEAGEHLFVQGSSGSGKTTLLNLLSGIHTPTTGTVRLLQTDLSLLSPSRRDKFRADHLGVVFQQFNLLPYLSTLENVTLACRFSSRKAARTKALGGADNAARELLRSLNLQDDTHNNPVSSLSVGQQQRVAVARALIGNPEILIADEPTSALDADNRQRFLDLLFQEADARETTLVFVSHDKALAERFTRTIKLSEATAKPEATQ